MADLYREAPVPHRARDGDAGSGRPTGAPGGGDAPGGRHRRGRSTRHVRALGVVTAAVALAYGSIVAIQLYAWTGGR